MPSVIIVSNYFGLKRQHSSHCQGRESVFSEILWTRAIFLPSEDQEPRYSFLTPRAHLGRIPQRSIFLFVDSFLPWAVGRAFSSPLHSSTPGKCPLEAPLRQLCVGWAQRPLQQLSSLGPRKAFVAKFTGNLPITPTVSWNLTIVHNHNNKLKIKHFELPKWKFFTWFLYLEFCFSLWVDFINNYRNVKEFPYLLLCSQKNSK